MRRVAMLAPMPSELAPLVARLGLKGDAAGLLRGTVGGLEVVALRTGIGMRAGARAAERVLAEAAPDHVFVVGVAGGIGDVAIGDAVVPESVRDLASGETFRPATVPGPRPRGTLVSSDALLTDPGAAARLRAQGVIAVDMETAAIARVCQARGCPWSAFRAISDRADDGSTDAAILGLVDSDGAPDLRAVARFALTRPRRIPQLFRLARGAGRATRAAADAAVAALGELGATAREPRSG